MKFKKHYIVGMLLLAGSLVLDARMIVDAATAPLVTPEQQAAPDNTKTNKDNPGPTADQQKSNTSDREITRKIRAAIHSDNSLSTYGHNVKIITQDGKVTLRGPVRTDEEKTNIEAKAVAVAGEGHVDDQLEVAPKQ